MCNFQRQVRKKCLQKCERQAKKNVYRNAHGFFFSFFFNVPQYIYIYIFSARSFLLQVFSIYHIIGSNELEKHFSFRYGARGLIFFFCHCEYVSAGPTCLQHSSLHGWISDIFSQTLLPPPPAPAPPPPRHRRWLSERKRLREPWCGNAVIIRWMKKKDTCRFRLCVANGIFRVAVVCVAFSSTSMQSGGADLPRESFCQFALVAHTTNRTRLLLNVVVCTRVNSGSQQLVNRV